MGEYSSSCYDTNFSFGLGFDKIDNQANKLQLLIIKQIKHIVLIISLKYKFAVGFDNFKQTKFTRSVLYNYILQYSIWTKAQSVIIQHRKRALEKSEMVIP